MTDPIIAVIDQDPDFLTTMNEALAQSGYIAILSQGDREAELLMHREKPSLIIIDGSMCESTSTDSPLESVIADAVLQHIPMLMTVSNRQQPLTGPEWHVYTCESLSKPIDPNELESKLRSVLGPLALVERP